MKRIPLEVIEVMSKASLIQARVRPGACWTDAVREAVSLAIAENASVQFQFCDTIYRVHIDEVLACVREIDRGRGEGQPSSDEDTYGTPVRSR